jgi:hypothetical protein
VHVKHLLTNRTAGRSTAIRRGARVGFLPQLAKRRIDDETRSTDNNKHWQLPATALAC